MKNAVELYREAAMRLYGLTRTEAERSIYSSEDDPGEWAPDALAVICLENGDGLSDACGYYSPGGLDECIRLADEAGIGFVEWINPAVAAVWE